MDKAMKDIELFNDSFQNYKVYGIPKVHPTQKPVPLLERLIGIFTDKGDVVIDPCAGSGTTLLAAANMGRKAYGFEVNKGFYSDARNKVLRRIQPNLFT